MQISLEKKWQSALDIKNVSDFVIDSFAGRQGLKDSKEPAILLDNVKEGIIRNSRAANGTNSFVHVQGNASNDISLRNNNKKSQRGNNIRKGRTKESS